MPTKYKYPVIVEKGETNYGVYLPDIDGCIAVGDTPEEALDRMKRAFCMHLGAMVRDGDFIPKPSPVEAIHPVEGVETIDYVEVEI